MVLFLKPNLTFFLTEKEVIDKADEKMNNKKKKVEKININASITAQKYQTLNAFLGSSSSAQTNEGASEILLNNNGTQHESLNLPDELNGSTSPTYDFTTTSQHQHTEQNHESFSSLLSGSMDLVQNSCARCRDYEIAHVNSKFKIMKSGT